MSGRRFQTKPMAAVHLDDCSVTTVLNSGRRMFLDAVDADLLQGTWTQGKKYAQRIVRQNGRPTSEYIHRIILSRIIGRSLNTDEMADHIDGNPLNNRRDNLRVANRVQNAANSRRRINNKSGFKGVRQRKDRWHATINGRFIGSFLTPEEAHAAYCAAAREKYGEFANFGDANRD